MPKLRIYIAGHRGMVGSALVRNLKKKRNEIIIKTRSQLNLLNQKNVLKFFENQKIDKVYLAAARVGGIYANNSFPADFIYENIMIQTNIIHAAFKTGVKKLLFLGSSCIYPRETKQPMKEEQLLTGKLEPTNEPYAIAKIAGIKLCESYNRQYGKSHNIDFRSVMPTNLYGPGDNYHPKNSHVIPALINRFHNAKIKSKSIVSAWGSGKQEREFLYVDDMAKACIFIMNLKKSEFKKYTNDNRSFINIGSGYSLKISKLSKIIAEAVGYKGKINFDKTKLQGSSIKLLDNKRLNLLGWFPEVSLENGLVETYKCYLKKYKNKL